VTHTHTYIYIYIYIYDSHTICVREIVYNTVLSVSTSDRNDSGGKETIHRLSLFLSLFLSAL